MRRTFAMYNLPNLLSSSRIVATVLVFVLVIVNQPWAFLIATVVFFQDCSNGPGFRAGYSQPTLGFFNRNSRFFPCIHHRLFRWLPGAATPHCLSIGGLPGPDCR